LVTETFQSFVSLTAVIKLTLKMFFRLYFETFGPKLLNNFQSFQKHFVLMTEEKQPHSTVCLLHFFALGLLSH